MPKIISHTPKKHQEITYDPSHIQLTITCQSGLESLVRRESEKIGLKEVKVQDRLISGLGNLTQAYELLVRSRFANRIYIDIHTAKITDFDTLHDTLADISWGDYLTGKELIVIEASSTRSTLSSIPTIQSVSQKAIFSTLHTPNNAHAVEVHILILIIDDIAHILLDITGDPLHKRGYREEAGEAPIKENLAAALVAFTSWKYREPLFDPFCGSGTIAIEAAMLARNIAP
jgi:putative N6-adenine-specific DNA methylase